MTPVGPRIATCTGCHAHIRIPDDVKPGHRVICTHCNAQYYAWQLLARAQRIEEKPADGQACQSLQNTTDCVVQSFIPLSVVSALKGTLQKTIESSSLACRTCLYFRGDDPDIFYCVHQREEFPCLCEQYDQGRKISDARNDWTVPDDL